MASKPTTPKSGATFQERNLQRNQLVSNSNLPEIQREWLGLIAQYEEDFIENFVADRKTRLEEMAKLTLNKLKEVKTDEELAALMYQMAAQITATSLGEEVEIAKQTVSIRFS